MKRDQNLNHHLMVRPADFLLDWTVSLENIETSELIGAQVCARETKRTAFSLFGMGRLWAEQLG